MKPLLRRTTPKNSTQEAIRCAASRTKTSNKIRRKRTSGDGGGDGGGDGDDDRHREEPFRGDRAPEDGWALAYRERAQAHQVEPEIRRLRQHPRRVPVNGEGPVSRGSQLPRHENRHGETQRPGGDIPDRFARSSGKGCPERARSDNGHAEHANNSRAQRASRPGAAFSRRADLLVTTSVIDLSKKESSARVEHRIPPR